MTHDMANCDCSSLHSENRPAPKYSIRPMLLIKIVYFHSTFCPHAKVLALLGHVAECS